MPPLSFSFLLAFIAEQTSYGMEYPFGQFGSAVLAVSPPKLLPTPSLLLGGMLERSLGAVTKPWCVTNTSLAASTTAQRDEGCCGDN